MYLQEIGSPLMLDVQAVEKVKISAKPVHKKPGDSIYICFKRRSVIFNFVKLLFKNKILFARLLASCHSLQNCFCSPQ